MINEAPKKKTRLDTELTVTIISKAAFRSDVQIMLGSVK